MIAPSNKKRLLLSRLFAENKPSLKVNLSKVSITPEELDEYTRYSFEPLLLFTV
jgi:hypothetical protein